MRSAGSRAWTGDNSSGPMLRRRRLRDALARAALLGPLVVAFPAATQTGGPPPLRRGPFEAREEWLLAQGRLNLPALSPDPVGREAIAAAPRLRLGERLGHAAPGTSCDGEHRSLAAAAELGIGDAVA